MLQCGVTLIEVLVTIVILSFGLLGVAGLLVGGVSNTVASEAATKASQLAADMADRIRANPANALTGSYNTLYATTETVDGTIAKSDLVAWKGALASQLPSGQGEIGVTSAANRHIDINVRWNNCLGTLSTADKTSCAGGTAQYRSFTFEVRL